MVTGIRNGIKVEHLPGHSGYQENWTTDGNYWSDNHRIDGPACTFKYAFGRNLYKWCIYGNNYFHSSDFQRDALLSHEEMTMIILKYGPIE